MESEALVFASSFEGLFHAELRKRITPALALALRNEGVVLDKPFLPAYPVAVWARALALCVEHLFPEDAPELAYRKLGRSTIEGYGQTLIGRAAMALMKVLGPARSLERATRTFASANNYTRVRLDRLGQTAFDLHINATKTPPEFDLGVVETVLLSVGAQDLSVTLQSQDATGFTMRLTWR